MVSCVSCVALLWRSLLVASGAAVWLGQYTLWCITPAEETVAAAAHAGGWALWLLTALLIGWYFALNVYALVEVHRLVPRQRLNFSGDEVCVRGRSHDK